MKIDGDYIIFSTGKKLYVCLGVIGLAPDFKVTGGFDDELEPFHDEEYSTMTQKERIELANYMIKQWEKYKNKASKS